VSFRPRRLRLFVLMLCFSAAGLQLHAQQTVAGLNSAFPEAPAAPAAAALPSAPEPQPFVTAVRKNEAAKPHAFFDKTNLRLFIAEGLAQTGDLITTRKIVNSGGTEADPLAKPFVNAGIGGQMVGSYVVGTGGTMLASYLLHRTGHHRLERWAPILATAIESLATISNIHQLTLGGARPTTFSVVTAGRAVSSPIVLHPAAGSH